MEFVVPFEGWIDASIVGSAGPISGRRRLRGRGRRRRLALWWRRSGPWTWAIVISLAFLAVLDLNVIGLDFNGTRTTMQLLAISLIALLERPAVSPGVR